jgi:exopolysaccharide production protein ExoZ
MSTAPRGKLVGIEAGRGLAAIMVVLYHASRHLDAQYGTPILRSVFEFGHAGVDFFFVLSGFIILFVHLDDIGRPARIGAYLSRRVIRVMPTYWVALATSVLLGAAGGHGWPSASALAWSASLLPSQHQPLLSIAWTLQYEILFYGLFCTLVLDRRLGIAVFALFLAAIVRAAAGGGDFGIPTMVVGVWNIEFLFGMAVAYWLRRHRMPAPRAFFTLGLSLFAIAALCEDTGYLDGYGNWGRLAYGLSSALILLGLAELSRQDRLAVPASLRELGAASYSIYLFQFIFIGIAWRLWLASGLDRATPHATAFMLLVAGAVLGGMLVSRAVEYRLIRSLRRGIAKAEAAMAA